MAFSEVRALPREVPGALVVAVAGALDVGLEEDFVGSEPTRRCFQITEKCQRTENEWDASPKCWRYERVHMGILHGPQRSFVRCEDSGGKSEENRTLRGNRRSVEITLIGQDRLLAQHQARWVIGRSNLPFQHARQAHGISYVLKLR